jgi:dihydrolipoamide dehydrogenase
VFLSFNAYWLLRKQFQKSLTKQGLKFRLSTKVLSAKKRDGKVVVTTEAVEDGKQEMVRGSQNLISSGVITGSP